MGPYHGLLLIRATGHVALIFVLTVLTQLGGVAWGIALFFRRRLLVFMIAYVTLSVAAFWSAPFFGRVALPCGSQGNLQVQSGFYCALNRHYVTPKLKSVLIDFADDMAREFPGTVTEVLDANFPFGTGFPLLPHVSHDDGEKADLAFYYRDRAGYLPGVTRSLIGYFAFEEGPTNCPVDTGLTLRWDMGWLQGLWPDYTLDPPRMRFALRWLGDEQRLGKIFIEPHLARRFDVSGPRIRFQGCRAARHDDHIHIQL